MSRLTLQEKNVLRRLAAGFVADARLHDIVGGTDNGHKLAALLLKVAGPMSPREQNAAEVQRARDIATELRLAPHVAASWALLEAEDRSLGSDKLRVATDERTKHVAREVSRKRNVKRD
jgi:hypothetical protein